MCVKRLDQCIGRHDGIAAILRDGDMHRNAAHAQPKPDGTSLAAGDGMARWFRHQRGIGAIAAQQGGKRTITGAFFLGHRFHIDIGGGLEPRIANGIHGIDHAGHARFHVMRAAAIHPAIADHGSIGRVSPHIGGAFGHDINMALQDQAAPSWIFGAIGRHHLHAAGGITFHHRRHFGVLRHISQSVAIHRIAARGHLAGKPILQGRFPAAQAWKAHQFRQELHLLVEIRVYGGGNARHGFLIGHADYSFLLKVLMLRSRSARSSSKSADRLTRAR